MHTILSIYENAGIHKNEVNANVNFSALHFSCSLQVYCITYFVGYYRYMSVYTMKHAVVQSMPNK